MTEFWNDLCHAAKPDVKIAMRVLHAVIEHRSPEPSDEAALRNLRGVIDPREVDEIAREVIQNWVRH